MNKEQLLRNALESMRVDSSLIPLSVIQGFLDSNVPYWEVMAALVPWIQSLEQPYDPLEANRQWVENNNPTQTVEVNPNPNPNPIIHVPQPMPWDAVLGGLGDLISGRFPEEM